MKTHDDITKTIGNTPIIRLHKIDKDLPGNIFAKAEFFNPLGSVKDRIGLSMIEAAEKEGKLKEGATVIEPTSGNTGIALAFVCAARGYRLILTMPDTMSAERRALLKILGAELVLTPGEKGMQGAVDKAAELVRETPGSFMPQQFENKANPEAHYKTTAPEIWGEMDGKVDIFVAGIGTGGTITGVGSFLKEKDPEIRIVGVEPEDSAVLSGKKPAPHRIQGIGAGFIPKVLKKDLLDEIITVSDKTAGEYSRRLAREEGVLVGISAGANVAVSADIASKEENKGKNILTVLCDTGERYLSTWLFEEYMK
ncbi:MAG: cysteine synthase A [Candidatus Omnitrophota bacterium]|jgi:cysteine synthase A